LERRIGADSDRWSLLEAGVGWQALEQAVLCRLQDIISKRKNARDTKEEEINRTTPHLISRKWGGKGKEKKEWSLSRGEALLTLREEGNYGNSEEKWQLRR